jgi:hypothetical protein
MVCLDSPPIPFFDSVGELPIADKLGALLLRCETSLGLCVITGLGFSLIQLGLSPF